MPCQKLYYEKYFAKYKSDIKKTWGMINSIIGQNKKNEFPKCFVVDNNYISDKQKIADAFNEYYAEAGTKLAQTIRTLDGINFQKYMNLTVAPDFEFHTTNRNTVIKVIESLKIKNSCGFDMMATKLLQNVKIEVCVMINQSFVSGIFPDKLKIAKVVPLYKKNEKNKIEKYRPVSLLPCVSKVFERIIHDQLNEYFSSLKLFYKSQNGFRHSHSTELAALDWYN